MKPAHIVAKILNVHVVRRQQEVHPILGVYRQRPCGGGHRRFYHGLYGEAGERLPVGVETVVLLLAHVDGPRNIGAGLIGVELYGFPPAGNGRRLGGRGGDGVDEFADNSFLGALPRAVPNGVDGNIRGEDGAHVVFEVDEFRRAFVFLRAAVE